MLSSLKATSLGTDSSLLCRLFSVLGSRAGVEFRVLTSEIKKRVSPEAGYLSAALLS